MIDFLVKKRIEKLSLSEIENEIKSLELDIQKLENEISEFEIKKSELLKRNNHAIGSFKKNAESHENDVKEKIDALCKEIHDINSDIKEKEEALKELKAEALNKAQLLKDSHNQNLKELNDEYNEDTLKLENDYLDNTNKLKEELTKHNEDIDDKSSKKIDELTSRFNNSSKEYEKLIDDNNHDIDITKDNYRRLMDDENETKTKLLNERYELENDNKTKLSELEETHQKLSEELNTEYENKSKELDENLKAFKDDITKTLDEKQSELFALIKDKERLTKEYETYNNDYLNTKKSLVETLNNKQREYDNTLNNQNLDLEKSFNELAEAKKNLEDKDKEVVDTIILNDKNLHELEDKYNKELNDTKLDYENKLNERLNTLNQELEDYNNEIINLKKTYEDEKEAEEKRLANEYRIMQKRFLAKLKEIYLQKDELKNNLQNELTNLKRDNLIITDNIEELKKSFINKRDEINNEINRANINHNEALITLKTNYESQVSNLKTNFDNQLISLNDQISKTKTIIDSIKLEIALTQEINEKEVNNFNFNNEKLDEALSELLNTYQIKVNEINTNINDLKAKLEISNQNLSEIENNYSEAKTSLETKYQSDLELLNNEHQIKINELNDKFNNDRQVLEDEKAKLVTKHQSDIEELKKLHEVKVQEENDNFNQKVNANDSDIVLINANHQDELAKLNEIISNNKNEIESLNNDYQNLLNEAKLNQDRLNEEFKLKCDELKKELDNNRILLESNFIQDSSNINEEISKLNDLKTNLYNELENLNHKHQETITNLNITKDNLLNEKQQLIEDIKAQISFKSNKIVELRNQYTNNLKDLEVTKLKRFEELNKLRQSLDIKYKDQQNLLIKEELNLSNELANKTDELKLANEEEIAKFKLELNDFKANLETEFNTLSKEHEEKIKALENNRLAINQDLKTRLDNSKLELNDLNNIINTKQKALDDLKLKLDNEYDIKVKYFDNELFKYQNSNQDEINDYRVCLSDKLKELINDKDSLLVTIDNLNNDLSKLKANHEENLSIKNQTIFKLEEELEEKINLLNTELKQSDDEISNLKLEFDTKVDSLYRKMTTLEEAKANLDKEYFDLNEEAKAKHLNKMNELELNFKQNITKMNQDKEIIISKIKEEMDNYKLSVNDKIANLQEAYNELLVKHNEMIDETNHDYEIKFNELEVDKLKVKDDIKTLDLAFTKLEEETKVKLETLIKDYDDKKLEALNQFEKAKEDLSLKFNEDKNSILDELDILKKDKESILKLIEETTNKQNEVLNKLDLENSNTLNKLQNDIDELNEKINQKKALMDTYTKQYEASIIDIENICSNKEDELNSFIAGLNEALANYKQELNNTLLKQDEEYNLEIDNLRVINEASKKEKEDELAKTKDEYDNLLADELAKNDELEKELNHKLDELKAELDQKAKAKENELNQEIEILESKRQDLENSKVLNNQKIDDLINENETELNNLKGQYTQEINQNKNNFADIIKELQKSNDGLRNNIKTLRSDLAMSKQKYEEDLSAKEVEHIKMNQEMNYILEKAKNELDNTDNQITTLKANFDHEVSDLYEKMETYESQKIKLEKHYAKLRSDENDNFNQMMTLKRQTHLDNLEDLRQGLNEAIDAINKRKELIFEDYNLRLKELVGIKEAKEFDYKKQKEAIEAEHERTINLLNTHHEIDSNKLKTQISDILNDTEADNKTYDDYLLEYSNRKTKLLDDKNHEIDAYKQKTIEVLRLLEKERQVLKSKEKVILDETASVIENYHDKALSFNHESNEILNLYQNKLREYLSILSKK